MYPEGEEWSAAENFMEEKKEKRKKKKSVKMFVSVFLFFSFAFFHQISLVTKKKKE